MNFDIYKQVVIERRGKKPERYALLDYVGLGSFLVVKMNGGERPRKVFLLEVKDTDEIQG